MFISLAEQTIKFESWQTKKQMTYALAACDAGSILLGGDIEEPREFYSVTACLEWPNTSIGYLGIGICSEGHGLLPHLLLPSTDLFVLGFNSEAVGIKQKKKHFGLSLGSLFCSFVFLSKENLILVFHEIGVVAINKEGQERWRYDKDVIVDRRIGEDSLELGFMDSPPVRLDLKTGKILQ
jgi:hypothetical protein